MSKHTYIGRASDGLILCEAHEGLQLENYDLISLAKSTLKTLSRSPEACVLETDLNHTIYYKTFDGICYLVCTEVKYPKKLALAFLDELISGFQDEIKKTWGTGESLDIRSRIETIEKPYYFNKFSGFIKGKKQEDMNPANNLEGAHKKLDGLKNITRRDIDNLYGRYRRLAEIEASTENLN